jgi:hypothetical protein
LTARNFHEVPSMNVGDGIVWISSQNYTDFQQVRKGRR